MHHIPIGTDAPHVINVIVEIPRGSHNKYEYDEELNIIALDRVLHSPIFYPYDYGFIPETRSEDGDHLDALMLISEPTFSGCLVKVRPIGVMDMEDEAGPDAKIITVAVNDPRFNDVQTLDDLNEHAKKEIEHFFQTYKHLEGKWVKVHGWLAQSDAYHVIQKAQERFRGENKL